MTVEMEFLEITKLKTCITCALLHNVTHAHALLMQSRVLLTVTAHIHFVTMRAQVKLACIGGRPREKGGMLSTS